MDYLDPFLIYTPNEPGMTASEIESAGKEVKELHSAIHDSLKAGVYDDSIDDKLIKLGIEPDNYWEDVEFEFNVALGQKVKFSSLELLDSGLVIVR